MSPLFRIKKFGAADPLLLSTTPMFPPERWIRPGRPVYVRKKFGKILKVIL